jgi:hypothetical protein
LPLPEYRRERDIALPDKIGKPQTAAAKGQDTMNTTVSEQIGQAYLGIWYAILLAVALYFLKVIIALVLKMRMRSTLAPGLLDDAPQTFFPRVLSLVGMGARARQTLGVTRLRATLGLRMVIWGGFILMLLLHRQMGGQPWGPETLIAALVLLNAVQIELYEIAYDKVEVTLPRWWFRRSLHRWRDLVAVTDKDPWMMTLHFADGRRVKVHKYIVGHAAFMAVAKDSIRNV